MNEFTVSEEDGVTAIDVETVNETDWAKVSSDIDAEAYAAIKKFCADNKDKVAEETRRIGKALDLSVLIEED